MASSGCEKMFFIYVAIFRRKVNKTNKLGNICKKMNHKMAVYEVVHIIQTLADRWQLRFMSVTWDDGSILTCSNPRKWTT